MTLDYSLIQQSRSVRISMNGSAAESKIHIPPSLFPFCELTKRSNRRYDSGLSAIVHVLCVHVAARVSVWQREWTKGRQWKSVIWERKRKKERGEERTRGRQVRKKGENKREKEEEGSGGSRSSINGGHWSHPPRTDRLSLLDSQVRLHDNQLLVWRLRIRDHRRPGWHHHQKQECEPSWVWKDSGWCQDLHEASQGSGWYETTGAQMVRLQLFARPGTRRGWYQHRPRSTPGQVQDRVGVARESRSTEEGYHFPGESLLFTHARVAFPRILNEIQRKWYVSGDSHVHNRSQNFWGKCNECFLWFFVDRFDEYQISQNIQ